MKLEDLIPFLKTVTECGGYLFGGFVRDALVPTFLNTHTSPFIPTPLGDGKEVSLEEWEKKNRDIDIFFELSSQKDKFLEMMGEHFVITNLVEVPISSSKILELETWNGVYNSFRISGEYILHPNQSIRVDLVWGQVFPAYDVDVAVLTCQYRDCGFWFSKKCKNRGYHTILELLKQISKKRCRVTEEYKKWMVKDNRVNYPRFEKRVDRLFQKYSFRGWEVYIHGKFTLWQLTAACPSVSILYRNPKDPRLPAFRVAVFKGIMKISDMVLEIQDSILNTTLPLSLSSSSTQ